MRIAFLYVVATIIAVGGFAGTTTDHRAAATGVHQYIAKLQYLFAQPNASAPAPIRSFIPSLGGHVDNDWHDRLIITIPDAALPAVKAHGAVKYLQRVVSGPFVPDTNATSSGVRNVESKHALMPTSTPPWNSGTYSYDGAGNIIQIGPGSVGTDTFQYDEVSRLKQANVRGHALSYAYDAFGNITNKTEHVTASFAVDENTNRLQTEGYDAAGNDLGDGTSQRFWYDPFNMMREKDIGSSSTLYVYTTNDERIGAITCSATSCTGQYWTITLRDEGGSVLRQYETAPYDFGFPSQWLWVEDYVYRDGLLLGAERVPEEGGRRHFHLDHLGTPRIVSDDAGVKMAEHDYYPFGVEISNPPTQPAFQDTDSGWDREEPMRFTGHERDLNIGSSSENDSYNDYLHARQTVPAWGRFLSADPALGDVVDPQSWNRYAYVLNNPIRFIDPDGLADKIPTPTDPIQCGSVDAPCNIDVPEPEPSPRPTLPGPIHLTRYQAGLLEFAIFKARSLAGARSFYSKYRAPDYYAFTVNLGTWVGGTVQIVNDRYGRLYWAPGGNVGKSATTLSGSFVGGWLNQVAKPTPDRLKNYIEQWSIGAGAGYGLGGNRVWGMPGVGKEVGAFSPQAGVTLTYGLQLPLDGYKW